MNELAEGQAEGMVGDAGASSSACIGHAGAGSVKKAWVIGRSGVIRSLWRIPSECEIAGKGSGEAEVGEAEGVRAGCSVSRESLVSRAIRITECAVPV